MCLKQMWTGHDRWSSLRCGFGLDGFGYRCNPNLTEVLNSGGWTRVGSLDDLERTLAGFEYLPRSNEDGSSAWWQTPAEFEASGGGHCADFALWTWAQVCQLHDGGLLFVGERLRENSWRQHAWVQLRLNSEETIFEPLPIVPDVYRYQASSGRETYSPWATIDAHGITRMYGGYVDVSIREFTDYAL